MEEEMTFRKDKRSYHSTRDGYRLATFEEATRGLATIKQQGLLDKWDKVRLLDGWITGPGYEYQMGKNFRSCLGYMLLIQPQASPEIISGSVYDGVELTDAEKQVALFLCVEDWNLELVYWLLNSWAAKEPMNIQDVIEGRIPFSDVTKFKEMNNIVSILARKIGDQGPVDSMKAEKSKYSGPQSFILLLSDRIKLLEEDPDIKEHQINGKFIALPTGCCPSSLESQWLAHVVNEGGKDWKDVANVFWNFLYDNYAEFCIERFSTDSCLGYIYSENSKVDRNTMSTSQMNFTCAISILLYLSYYRCNIAHAANSHGYRNDCAQSIIRLAANEAANHGKDAVKHFNQILGNNALWRYYQPTGNYDLINKLLVCATRGIDRYIIVPDQQTDLLMIKRLLECGAQPATWLKLTTHKEKRALDYAVKWKDEDLGIKCAKCLLDGSHEQQRDELVNARDVKGRTALHRASSAGNSLICQLLLDYGAPIDAQDKKGKTALHLACEKIKEKVINVFGEDQLIANSVDLKDEGERSPLNILLSLRDTDIGIASVTKVFLKSNQPEVYTEDLHSETGEHLLRELLVKGHVDTVEKLSANVAKLPGALNFAAMCDDEFAAWSMIYAILTENQENMEELVRSDKRGKTVLHEAAFSGHTLVCKFLIGANSKIVNIQDVDGRNALYDAVKGKRCEVAVLTELVSAFLKRDNVLDNLIDRSGQTPLHVAASLGKTEVVRALLSKSKNPENYVRKSDFLGKTALHNAAHYGDSNTVNILLHHGAKPLKERDCDGRTALHYAVQSKTVKDKKELINSLLNGCNTNDEKLLFLWASAVGLGTADHNLRNNDLHEFLVHKKKGLGSGNLLQIAAKVGDIEMTKELITRGYQVGDLEDPKWRTKLEPSEQENVDSVSLHLVKIAEQGNDRPTISDNLGRIDYAQGLVALLLNPYTKPPITVGISGSWGMGKSSLMVQTESILLKTAAQMALLPSSKLPTSALKLPDVKTFELSSKGKTKYGEIKRYVDYKVSKKGKRDYRERKKPIDNEQKSNRSLFSTIMDKISSWLKKRKTKETLEEAGQDSLSDFLRDYKVEYRKIFKLLAAMNSSHMFTTSTKEDSKYEQPPPKATCNMFKKKGRKDKHHENSLSMTMRYKLSRNVEQSEVDYQREENVPAVLTVQYNAWKYRNETEALAGIAVEITKELEGIMSQAQWISTCWRNTWKKRKYNILIEIFYPSILAIILACTFTWIVWIALDRYNFKDWAKTKYACLPAAIVIIGWTLTKSVMGILKPVSTQLLNYISFPNHTDKLGYQERVISDINFLKDEIGKNPYIVFTTFSWVLSVVAQLWLLISECWFALLFFHPIIPAKTMLVPNVALASGRNLRIIVFIDDLDRCQESVILQVLSAINLVLAVCEISVVLGIDKELIEKAIIKKHGDLNSRSFKHNKELADKYLQKIIQLPLDLPDPSEEQSRIFLEGQLGVLRVRQGCDSEIKEDSQMSETSSLKTSIPGDTPKRETGQGPEITIDVQPSTQKTTTSDVEQIEREAATNPTDQRERDDPKGQNFSKNQQAENSTGNTNSSSAIWIREMLFVRYSQGEQDAFSCFQKMATNSRKLPREWKRLITYHRLVWNILYLTREGKDLNGWQVMDGWQVQLITWIFVCWEWQDNMNFVIENWNSIPDLKTPEAKEPSLQMIVAHFIEHELEEKKEAILQDNDSKNTNTLTESSNSEQKKFEDAVQCQGEMKKQKEEEKQAATEALDSAVKEQLADVLEKTVRKELDDLKKQVNDLKDLVMKQFCMKTDEKQNKLKLQSGLKEETKGLEGQNTKHGRKNEKREEENRMKLEWKRLRSALRRYDVSMDGILAFQRFRFYCKARHLSWPLPQQENEKL